jgi:hypothetical protein
LRGHGVLARQLGAAVGGAGTRGVALGVRLGGGAVEDIVGGHVDEKRSGGGEISGAVAIDARRGLFLGLRAVDVGPPGAVHDRVGAGVGDGGADGVGVGDVELGAGERDHVVARALRGGDDGATQHPRCPCDEKAHGRTSLASPQG